MAVRAAVAAFRGAHLDEVDKVADLLGCKDAKEPGKDLVEEYRSLLRQTVGATPELRPPRRWGAPAPLPLIITTSTQALRSSRFPLPLKHSIA